MTKRKVFLSLFQKVIRFGSITLTDEYGVTTIGSGVPHVVIRIHNQSFYSQVLGYGNLGLGESYINHSFEVEEGSCAIDY